MKHVLSFFLGILTAATILTITHYQGMWVTKNEMEAVTKRESTLMAVYITLRHEQREFAGERKANGCYNIQNPMIQEAVTRHAFTSTELGQSIDELLCYGWTVPSDF